MSGSQSGQQGWFHRVTGRPFTPFIGVQKPPNQLDIQRKKNLDALNDAIQRKKQLEEQLKQQKQDGTQYQGQISELKKEKWRNILGTQGRMIAKELDSDWGYVGEHDPGGANYNDRNQFHQDRQRISTARKDAEGKLQETKVKTTSLETELTKTQNEINLKTILLVNPVQKSSQ